MKLINALANIFIMSLFMVLKILDVYANTLTEIISKSAELVKNANVVYLIQLGVVVVR